MPGDRLDSLKARRISAGLTVGRLASLANVSDREIHEVDNGAICSVDVTPRILAALAPVSTITVSTIANPTVLTTTTAHKLVTGDTVTILGHTGSTPAVDVTVTGATTFTVPVNVSADGTGGTVTLSTTSIGKVYVA